MRNTAKENHARLLQERFKVGDPRVERFHFTAEAQRVFPRYPAFLLRTKRITLTCAKLVPDFVKLSLLLFYIGELVRVERMSR